MLFLLRKSPKIVYYKKKFEKVSKVVGGVEDSRLHEKAMITCRTLGPKIKVKYDTKVTSITYIPCINFGKCIFCFYFFL